MNARFTITYSKARRFLLIVLVLTLPVHGTQANGDRIFTDGFEPCCLVGGTTSGLNGAGLVLRLSAGSASEGLPITRNGPYNFVTRVPTNTSYIVTIDIQPNGTTCTVANSSGTIGSADVNNVHVACGDGLLWDQGDWGEVWQ